MIPVIDGSLPARGQAAKIESRRVRGVRAFSLGVLAILLLSAVLFLLGTRWVIVHDEGIATTNAMRVLAGQVTHRDSYYNYGAGTVYLLAGLFKIFGMSLLVERLAGVFEWSLLILSVYMLARKYCGPKVAIFAGLLGFVWSAADVIQGFEPPLTCIPLLWSTWLVLPVNDAAMQRRRAFGAGLLVGLLFLFRYDMGIGVACAHALAVLLFALVKDGGLKQRMGWLVRGMWPYPAGVLAMVTIPAIAYLRVAPLHDLLYDVFLFQAKYYRMGRGLPLPRLTYASLPDCVIYLAMVVIAAALYAIVRELRERKQRSTELRELQGWTYLLLPLSIVAALVLVKGIVRASAGQMIPCIFCCLVILAVLLEQLGQRRGAERVVCFFLAALFAVTGSVALLQKMSFERNTNSSVLKWIARPTTEPPFPPFRNWCNEGTPLTKGFCFFLSPDHIQAIEYVRANTRPGDTLYVGLTHHDQVFVNDNITYFATQLLPATKWSQFDPFLQNRLDIQQEMIGELETKRPRYVVLEGEFENSGEPNGSSISTGVHLLDDYISSHYRPVQQYGKLTILQRQG